MKYTRYLYSIGCKGKYTDSFTVQHTVRGHIHEPLAPNNQLCHCDALVSLPKPNAQPNPCQTNAHVLAVKTRHHGWTSFHDGFRYDVVINVLSALLKTKCLPACVSMTLCGLRSLYTILALCMAPIPNTISAARTALNQIQKEMDGKMRYNKFEIDSFGIESYTQVHT